MKTIISLCLLMFSYVAATSITAAEKDVWYDANGNVVKITKAQKEKKVYVPLWKKSEQERLARMEAQRLDKSARSRSSRNNYWDPYTGYYSAGYYSGYGYHYRPHYSHGWSCRPAYRYGGGHGHSSFRFNGAYRGGHSRGWSVRVKF